MVAIRWSHRLLGLVSTMVLARILAPADFGIVAVIAAIVAIVEGLFQFGFHWALINDQSAGPEHYNAAWSLVVLKAQLVALIVLAAAPFAEGYSDTPHLMEMAFVAAAAISLRGLANIGPVAFSKELEFDKVFKYRVYPRVLGVLTVIALAFILRSYWAMVFGMLANSVFVVLFSYLLHPYRPRFSLRRAPEIWSYSKWLVLRNMSRQLFMSADRLLMSGWVGKHTLGMFSVSADLAGILTRELFAPVEEALMPGFAKIQDDRERVRAAFRYTMAVFVGLVMPAGVGVWLLSEELTQVILGDKWSGAAPMIGLFGIFYIVLSVSQIVSGFMAMVGLVSQSAVVSVLAAVLFFAGIHQAFVHAGVEGVIQLKMGVSALELLALCWISARFIRLGAGSLLGTLWRPMVATALMAGTLASLPLGAEAPALLALAGQALVGAAVYAAASLALWAAAGRPEGLESMALDIARSRLPGQGPGSG